MKLLCAFAVVALATELPPYWTKEYGHTWRFSDNERYVNSTAWEEDSPRGYHDGVNN